MTHDIERVPLIPNDQDVQNNRGKIPVLLMVIIAAAGVIVAVATYVAIPSAFGGRDEPVTVSCGISPPDSRKGQRVALIYTVDAERVMTVGIGVEIYDHGGKKHANGTASVDNLILEETARQSGHQRWSNEAAQTLVIPDSLDPGTFQIVAEVWPVGRVQAERTTSIASALCGYVSVSDE